MKSLTLHPSVLGGKLQVPPSKSDSHRGLITAALADTPSRVDALIYSEDILATLAGLEAFGCQFVKHDTWVQVIPGPLVTPKTPIDCRESGSTLRFLIPLALRVQGPTTFTGVNRLIDRPLDDYIQVFKSKGVAFEYEGKLPLKIWGKPISGQMRLTGKTSSQYYSGLFFSLPLMLEDSTLEVDGNLESKGYVDMTIETLKHHGITIKNDSYKTFYIGGGQKYKTLDYTVEGDYSNAAFWIVAGQLNQPIHLTGLKQQTKQSDQAVIDLVKAMGGQVTWIDQGLVTSPSKTQGICIDASEIPDLIPILCVLAALSEGQTQVVKGSRLRLKESDRIKSTVTELSKLGANITETEDGMVIEGQPYLHGGHVDAWNDHRIAMALAIASTRCQSPVVIDGFDCVKKSYPHFFDDFKHLGGQIYE